MSERSRITLRFIRATCWSVSRSAEKCRHRATRSEPVVKSCRQLICTIPIRSLRTKWSRMENKAACCLFLYLGSVSAIIVLVRQGRARIHGEENEQEKSGQACIATNDPGDR